MDFNKLLPVVGEVNEESLERLANEMKRQIEEEDLDFDNMEKKVQGQISLENRKYGRGAVLLGPYGYFYPEQMLPAMADNASRGRLLKKAERALYTYDFNDRNEVIRIAFPPSGTTVFCMRMGKDEVYFAYEREKILSGIAFIRYDDNGFPVAVVNTRWYGKKECNGIIIEKYKDLDEASLPTKRFGEYYDGRFLDNRLVILVNREYELTYDDKKQIVDWIEKKEEIITTEYWDYLQKHRKY